MTADREEIVIDLKGAHPSHLVAALRHLADHLPSGISPSVVGDFADQIEAQTKPARIPEPGVWGVVHARDRDYGRCPWINHAACGWVNNSGETVDWNDLLDPVLIRPGIRDESS